jgi:hypothetical protein
MMPNRIRIRHTSKPGRLASCRWPSRPFLEKLETRLAPANVDVLRYHYDLSLTGQNLQEQLLHPGPGSDPTALNATNFGTLFSSPIDGQAYAQPLYKSNVVIPGQGMHNVAFLATEHDSVYAFDADNGTQYWQHSFIDPAHGITTTPYYELSTPDLFPEIGITGTGVIDASTNTLYQVVKTREVRADGGVHYVQKLHALDLATGADKFGGPYQLGDTHVATPAPGSRAPVPVFANETTAIVVPGSGGESSGGANPLVSFSAEEENVRTSLQLVGNIVYIAFASHADFRPYHGWVIGFDKTTLQPIKVFNTAPNSDGVAIWESGGGMSVDAQGNLYFAVGNGFQLGPVTGITITNPGSGYTSAPTVTISGNGTGATATANISGGMVTSVSITNPGSSYSTATVTFSGGGATTQATGTVAIAAAFDPARGNYSESVIKIDPTPTWTPANPQMMTVVDYFTPFNWQQLDSQDADLGSGGVLQLPDAVGSTDHRHLMIETGKQGRIYLIDRDNMGHINNPPNGPDLVVQTVTAGQTGVWGNPAFFQTNPTSGIIYYHGSGDVLKGYVITNGHIDDASADILRSTFRSNFPGEQPSISADGISNPTNPVNGIVWELQVDNAAGRIQGVGDNTAAGPATLRAFRANDFSTVLYDSSQNGQRDFFGGSVKFTVPVVTNGHVLVGTADHFSVLGLFPAATAAPREAPSSLTAMLQSTSQGPQVRLNWTNPAPNPGMDPTGIEIFRSTDGSNFTRYNTVNRNLTTFTDAGPFQFGQRYYYRVVAANQVGESAPSDIVNLVVPIPPSVLTVAGTSASSIGLSWTPVTSDHYDVERSTDGTTFARINVAPIPGFQTSYTDTGLPPGLYTYRVRAFTSSADSLSNVRGAWIGATFDHSAGFGNGTDLTVNGNAFIGGNLLELTNQLTQAGSAFSNTRITIGRFTTSFQVRLHEGSQPDYADGFTFVLQANAPTALGQAGGGIGYQGIGNSVAIKFDTFDNEGEQNPDEMMTGGSTGLFYGGDRPTIPHAAFPGEVNIELDRTRVNLLSQSTKMITLSYDGTTLHEMIVDPDHASTPFSHDYTVNLSQLLGSDTAYVGFTGASGSGSFYELEDVLTWSFTSQAPLPGAPTSLRETAFGLQTIDLAWNPNSYNETGFQLERSTNGTSFTPIATTTATSFEDVGLVNGTYFYRVKALNGTGSSPYSSAFPVSLPGAILTQHQDIGTASDPAVPGSASFANGTYTMTASGSDIWGTADHMHYLYRPFVGDGQIIARVVTEQSGVNDFAKAGVMFRDSLAAEAKNAYMLEFPFPGSRGYPTYQWRDTTGGSTNDQDESGRTATPAPIWLRLVRSGNVFIGYYALDISGTPGPWIQLEAQTVVMGPTSFVGLALTSHNRTNLVTATFDHVQILPDMLQASRLDVSSTVREVNPGTALSITVQALDQYNNVVPGYRGTVHFTTSDAAATMPADYPFTAADNGRHTFTVTLRTLGRQTVNITDVTTPAMGGGGTALIVTNDVIVSSFTLAGFSSPTRTGSTHSFVVTARDASGQILTGYRGLVHFTSSDGLAGLPGDYLFIDTDAGAHTFNATLNTPGSQSITVTDSPAGVSASQTGILVAPPPAITRVNRNSAAINVGDTFTVGGSFSDAATGQTHQVVISWGDGSANTTLSLAAGVLSFSAGHLYTQTGDFEIHLTLTAADGTADAILLAATAVAALPPPGLVGWWTGDGNNPSTAADIAGTNSGTLNGGVTYAAGRVGNAFSFNGSGTRTNFVNIPDAASLRSTTGTWAFWVKTTQSGSFVGFVGKADATSSLNGIVMQMDQTTGNARIEVKSGSQTLLLNGTSRLNDGQFHFLALSFQSGGQVVLYVDGQQQASGTAPTFTFNPNPLRFGTMLDTFWAPYNGLLDEVQIWNRVLSATDVQAIFAAGAAGEVKGVRVQNFHYVVGGFPFPITAGTSGSFTVTVQDPSGLTVTGYRGTVHFTSSDGQAVLPADYTFTAVDNGSHTFTATLRTASTQSITATDTVNHSVIGTQSGILVNPAAASTLAVAGFPSPATAGQSGRVRVTAKDPYGNTATSYRGTVHFTSTDSQAFLPSDYAFQAADNGTAGFDVVFLTASTQALTATDMASPGINGTQTGIVVRAAAAASLRLAGFPSPGLSGLPGTFTVTAVDRFGNSGAMYTGTVTFTSSDSQAQLPADYTFTAADRGTKTFTAALITVGTRSITIADTMNPSLTATQSGIVVIPARFLVSSFPSPTPAGSAGVFTVTVVDGNGNPVTGYLGTVHFTSSDPQATLPRDYTFTAADGGTHDFGAVLKTAGPQSITVTDTSFSNLIGTQSGITVTPLSVAAFFVVTGFPLPSQAGTPGSFIVTAYDLYGNVAIGYTGTVTFTSSDVQAELPPDYTFTADDSGTHSFTATLRTAGPQSIIVTDTGNGANGSQDNIQVTPSVAVSLLLFGYPSRVTAGTLNLFTVTAVDAYGNTGAIYFGTIHFTSSDPAAVLPDDYTFTMTDSGTHVFAAIFNTPGTQSLTANDTADQTLTATQDGIEVVDGPYTPSGPGGRGALMPVLAGTATSPMTGPVPALTDSSPQPLLAFRDHDQWLVLPRPRGPRQEALLPLALSLVLGEHNGSLPYGAIVDELLSAWVRLFASGYYHAI